MGNERITDAAAIASEFNEYFTNIGTKLAESIPVINSSYKKFLRGPFVIVLCCFQLTVVKLKMRLIS